MVVQVAVTKESRNDIVGIVLEQKRDSVGDGRIVVSSIGYHSLFANTRLQVGMEVLSINNQHLRSAESAMQILRDAQDVIEVVAVEPSTSIMVVPEAAGEPRRRQPSDPDSGGGAYQNQDGTLIGAAAATSSSPPKRRSNSRGSYKPDPDGETGQSLRESQRSSNSSHKNNNRRAHAPPSSPPRQSQPRDPTMIAQQHPPPSAPPESILPTSNKQTAAAAHSDEESFEEETFVTTATPVAHNDQAYASVPVAAASAVGPSTRNSPNSQTLPDGKFKVTATKPSSDYPVGLHLRQQSNGDGAIVIDSIDGTSIFRGSALRPGMMLQSINGCDCTGMTTEMANILLVSSTAEVTILAAAPQVPTNGNNNNMISATATKASRNARVGIAMRRKDGIGFVVDSISHDSIFASTSLKVGMKVLTINGMSIQQGMSSQHVLSLLTNAESKITIVAETVSGGDAAATRNSAVRNSRNNNGNNNTVTATVTKPNPNARVGISMKRHEGVGFLVDSIVPGGLFDSTAIETGMKVLSVNGVPVDASMQSEEVLILLTSAPSNVTVVAERVPHNSNVNNLQSSASNRITVTATKPTPTSKVGIAMKRHEGVGFLIDSITPGSLFDRAAGRDKLAKGMKIVSINGVAVHPYMQSNQVLSLLTQAPSTVTIVAERMGNNTAAAAAATTPIPTPMVMVTAPADLMAGYQFDAQVNGRNFKVTVPPGGVRAGQQFQVPAPTEADFQQYTNGGGTGNDPIKPNSTGAPMGEFRNDMCSCCEAPCPAIMGLCCFGVLAGQVLQRLKLGPCGTPGDHENTCVIMTAIFFLALVITCVVFAATNVGYYVYYVVNIYLVVAVTCARKNMRERYNIPGTVCGDSCLDDCCCAYWCGCCAVIQMHRHTHDEKQYPYEVTSKTGLAGGAPEIV